MKFWNYSFLLSIASLCVLSVMSVLPNSYNAFSWRAFPADAAQTFFPVMCLCWIPGLLAVLLNNIFLDKCYITHNFELSTGRKYLPSILSLPGIFSFVWFCFRWSITM